MRSVGSDCVGCERCVNCGRKNGYVVYECDLCGKEIKTESGEGMYRLNYDKDVCLKCYVKEKVSEFIEDNWGDDAFMEILEDWADINKYALGEDGDDE